MARQFIHAVAVLAILLSLIAPAWASVDEGFAAYGRGEFAAAMREWEPLAEHGDAFAQFLLGDLYAEGQGIPQDYVRGHMWFNLAAAQGHNMALEKRKKLAKKMTAAQIAEAQRGAHEWMEKRKNSELSWVMVIRWIIGFVVINILGAVVIHYFIIWIRKVGNVPKNKYNSSFESKLFTNAIAFLERFVISLLVVLASISVAGTFVLAWMGMKMATNWGKEGRSDAFDFPKNTSKGEKFVALARGSLSALAGSLLSARFGVLGGLIVKSQLNVTDLLP